MVFKTCTESVVGLERVFDEGEVVYICSTVEVIIRFRNASFAVLDVFCLAYLVCVNMKVELQ